MSSTPRELWLATANTKKRGELERLLAPLGWTVRTLAEAPPHVVDEIVEDGDTFAANAAKKAVPLARAVGALALGDDSGLCVDALDGGPGVRSARWAGADATDADRIAKLLDALRDAPAEAGRGAHFACALCLAGPDGPRFEVEERCPGSILESPRGDGGFGYDPVFLAAAHRGAAGDGPSFAELRPEQKDAISHRGRALRRLVEFLSNAP